MTRTLFTLVLILAVVLCPEYAKAQTRPDTSQAPNAALREKAFDLLESAAGQLGTLQSAENRARLGANIADSLWKHDEKAARALFALVEEDIRAGLTNRDLQDEKDSQTLRVFLKLRVDTVERIAKYDGELALAFLQSTRFISDPPLHDVIQSEDGLELRLAKRMVSSSPDIAVEFARKSLADGFSEELLRLLRQLNKKHREQALILYKEVVHKLRDVDLSEDLHAQNFAQELVRSFKPPTTDHPTFRELIGLIITQALTNGCGNKVKVEGHKADFCRFVALLLPQLERVDPRATSLKQWIPENEEMNMPPEVVYEFLEIVEDGTIDELLAFAAKNPEIAPQIYAYAVRKAADLGDFEQAKKLVATHITDLEMKRLILAQIEGAHESRLFHEKRLAEMQSLLNQLSRDRDRIQALLAYVNQLAGKNRDAALKFLKQASDIADTMKPGKEQTEIQIRLAMMYCSEKSDRGFEIMESLMPKLNELVDAAVKLEGYETSYMRDGEWNMSANGSVGAALTVLSENAGHFAWCDFDRAVNVAAQFNRSEIRLMAQVKLAQAILAGPPTRARSPYDYSY